MRLSVTKEYCEIRGKVYSIAFLGRRIGGNYIHLDRSAMHLRSVFRLVYNLENTKHGCFWVRK